MSDSLDIKVDSEMKAALVQLFSLANMDTPPNTITSTDVLLAIREIKSQMESSVSAIPAFTGSGFSGGGGSAFGGLGGAGVEESSGGGGDSGGNPFSSMASMIQGSAAPSKIDISNMNILIAGELGIITYQLKLALTRRGATVTIVKGVDEAVSEYQKRNYTGVLIDIFMPTEREGLLVLMEIKRMEKEKGIHSDVVVLATPVKEKRMDLREICKQRGATVFLEKTEGWHQRVIDFYMGQLDPNE